jgi:hypothetical protein
MRCFNILKGPLIKIAHSLLPVFNTWNREVKISHAFMLPFIKLSFPDIDYLNLIL